MKAGVVGLGRMGKGIAQKLVEEGHTIVAWNRTRQDAEELRIKNSELRIADTIEDLVKQLDPPRVIWVMLPASAVEEILSEIKKYVDPGDVVVDGGNSNYKDTQKRFDEFESLKVCFLGVGVSGGILAHRNGFPLMAGGSQAGYEIVKPILESLSKPNGGFEYFGEGGAGHFVKMIHNGIEYGMMQSIAEGFAVLEKSDYQFDLPKVAKLWRKNTIVSSFLIDRISEMLEKDSSLREFEGVVARSGEGDWTLEAGASEDIALPAIESAVYYRKDSETDENIQRSFTARVLNALRAAFGGHEVRK